MRLGSLKSMSDDVPRNVGGRASGLQTSRRGQAASQWACKLAEMERDEIQGACKRPEKCWQICKGLALFLKNFGRLANGLQESRQVLALSQAACEESDENYEPRM